MKLIAAAMLAVVWIPSVAEGGEDREPTPTYTNQDLQRMAPLRHQTGALSQPAVPPASARESKPSRSRGRDERYWRREADKLRRRLRPLEEQRLELQLKIEERRATPGVRPYTDPKIEAWERKLESLTRRMRSWQSRLEDRARRAGALPGWLR